MIHAGNNLIAGRCAVNTQLSLANPGDPARVTTECFYRYGCAVAGSHSPSLISNETNPAE